MFVVVDLVNHKHDRFARPAQRAREIFVDRREPLLGIDHEQKKIAFIQRLLRGLLHLGSELFFAGAKNSARVPNRERFFSARADRRDSVARDSRLIVNDRDLPADQSIKQRGLSDIWATNDRNAWQFRLSVHRRQSRN